MRSYSLHLKPLAALQTFSFNGLLRQYFGHSQEYFNRPLSPRKNRILIQATLIKRLLTRNFYRLSGGTHGFRRPYKPVVIRRNDIVKVIDYARKNCSLRDYLLIRLAAKLGLRTGELAALNIEDLNFEELTVQVTDSKKHRKLTLPCDPLTMELLKQLVNGRRKGPVFLSNNHACKKPARMAVVSVWWRIREIARRAGVEDFKPRYFRYYFAAEWVRAGKNLELLRRLLRHDNIENTMRYVQRLTFFEDLQAEYLDFTGLPFKKADGSVCERCVYSDICKYAGRLPKFAKCERFKEKIVNGKI